MADDSPVKKQGFCGRIKILLAVFLVSGCASAERDPSPMLPPTILQAPVSMRKVQVTQDEIKGLSLEQALALADDVHPELAIARARVEAAEGRLVQAGLLPNPVLVARMESAPLNGAPIGNSEIVAGVSVPVPIGGRLGAGTRVWELDRERLLKEFEAKRLEVNSRVHAAFAAALYAEAVSKIQADALRIAENGVAVTKARAAAGDALAEEVARVEIEQVRARVELERSRSLRQAAFLELTTVIGEPEMRLESVDGKLDATLQIPTLESIAADLESTPLLAAADAEIATERARADLARAQRIPDVNLDLFYRRIGDTETNAFDVGISVGLPLFNRNQGAIREAEANAAAAEAKKRLVRNDVKRQLRGSYLRLQTAVAHARLLREEILPRSETVLKGAEIRYSGGDMGLPDLLPIRRESTTMQLGYLESLRDVMEAWASLKPFLKGK